MLTSKIKTICILATFNLGLIFGLALLSPAVTQAQFKSNVCGGAELKLSSSSECASDKEEARSKPLTNLIANIVQILSVIVGIVAVIMIIWGGFKFITSGGDSGNVASARNTIIYALIGLVIVALAQIIVRFVLTKTPS